MLRPIMPFHHQPDLEVPTFQRFHGFFGQILLGVSILVKEELSIYPFCVTHNSTVGSFVPVTFGSGASKSLTRERQSNNQK